MGAHLHAMEKMSEGMVGLDPQFLQVDWESRFGACDLTQGNVRYMKVKS